MMPLQQNKADASRMDKDMLVTSRVMNWEDEEAGDMHMRQGRMSIFHFFI
jgi:hypothetical protein